MQNRRQFIGAGAAAAAAAGCSPGAAPPAVSAIDRFRSAFEGRVLLRGAADYEPWRKGLQWQLDVPDRRPEIIVRPRTAEAAQKALAYAKDAGLKVAIKSGGHNISGAFLRDSGMLLDLAEFNAIETPADGANEIWVEPAAWSWNLARRIEPLGYSFPYAHCATVSMGGYLLGGGVGINGDAWGGISCHTVTGLKIMLPSGEIVVADETQYPDLFWAARGGGTGFFGAVLAFRLRLFPKATDIRERVILYPIDATEDASRWLETIATVCPKNIELLTLLAHRPPPLQGPSPREKAMCVVRLAAFGEKKGDGDRALAELDSMPPPAGALIPPIESALDMMQVLVGSVDPMSGLGFGRYNVDTIWTHDLPGAMGSIVDLFLDAPSGKSHILATPRHGASIRSDAAFSSLAPSFLGVYSLWDEEKNDVANVRWTHEAAQALNLHAAGRYINELDGFEFPEKVRSCFSAEAWTRLENLRAFYDPDGLFQGFPGA